LACYIFKFYTESTYASWLTVNHSGLWRSTFVNTEAYRMRTEASNFTAVGLRHLRHVHCIGFM